MDVVTMVRGASNRCLRTVVNGGDAFFVSAMRATKEFPASLGAVANDLATAMIASWCQGMDGAFEAIEIMGDPIHNDFKSFIVFVPANFAFSHRL
jgi:hypothetical protein